MTPQFHQVTVLVGHGVAITEGTPTRIQEFIHHHPAPWWIGARA